jgi:hypothetical protein
MKCPSFVRAYLHDFLQNTKISINDDNEICISVVMQRITELENHQQTHCGGRPMCRRNENKEYHYSQLTNKITIRNIHIRPFR